MLTTTKTNLRSTKPPRRLARPRYLPLLALIAAVATGCGTAQIPLEIAFEVRFDGQPIDCGSPVDGAALTDLRLFVHDLSLRVGDDVTEVELVDDGRWQDGRVALLDFEDGTGSCVNGSPVVNRTVRGTVQGGQPSAGQIEFSIGVPTELNHSDPLRAPAPRNYTPMHWHWSTGYKFLRAGIETPSDSAWMHLGSGRCSRSADGSFTCAASNQPRVRISEFDVAADVVVIDLARLFGPTLGDGSPWSCESGAAEASACRLAFAELGLEFATGRVLGPAPSIYARRR